MRRIITLQDVRALKPCTDPATYVSEEWQGTYADILKLENVKVSDRIWVVTALLDDKTNRLFAVWCARESFKIQDSVDARSIAACNVAERFANGEATSQELESARSAAESARSAAWSAMSSAAWSAMSSAAESAARSAAWSAMSSAAESAARSAAWSAMSSAAEPAQLEKLKEMTNNL